MSVDSPEVVLITIVMPAYNAAKFISEAIESVLKQTLRNWELLICDDRSTDATVSVVQSFSDPRIKLFVSLQNQGPGKSRDFLIQQAVGKWVAVLDADDVYESIRLETFYKIAQQNPNAIIFDEIRECHDAKAGLIPWGLVRDPMFLMGNAFSFDSLGREIAVAKWLQCERTMMKWVAPTEIIRKHGVTHPDVRFGEDLGFILRLLSATQGPLWYIPQPLYLYRLSTESLTTSPDRFDALLGVLYEAKGYIGFNTGTLSAINRKAKSVEKRLVYQVFFSALVRFRMRDVFIQAAKNPWVISELLKRVFERIPYHLHRKRHSGSKRKTT